MFLELKVFLLIFNFLVRSALCIFEQNSFAGQNIIQITKFCL